MASVVQVKLSVAEWIVSVEPKLRLKLKWKLRKACKRNPTVLRTVLRPPEEAVLQPQDIRERADVTLVSTSSTSGRQDGRRVPYGAGVGAGGAPGDGEPAALHGPHLEQEGDGRQGRRAAGAPLQAG